MKRKIIKFKLEYDKTITAMTALLVIVAFCVAVWLW